MFQFIAPKSAFRNNETHLLVAYGTWSAPYFKYVRLGRDQWLIMSYSPIVVFKGQTVILEKKEVAVKGEILFPSAGTYYLHYKVFAE
jgi:hypothetical protein